MVFYFYIKGSKTIQNFIQYYTVVIDKIAPLHLGPEANKNPISHFNWTFVMDNRTLEVQLYIIIRWIFWKFIMDRLF